MRTKLLILGLAIGVLLTGGGAYAVDGFFDNLYVGTGVTANKFDVRTTSGNTLTIKMRTTNATTLLDVDSSGANREARFQFRNNGTGTWRIRSFNNDNSLRFFDDIGNFDALTIKSGGNVGIGTSTPSQLLDVAGTASVQILEITGGADLAEHFKINNAPKTGMPGMVVSIDPEHPGEMTLCTVANDRKVAGIISGAGDLDAGITLGELRKARDGYHPVALTGKAWCWVDASFSPVTPGDSLTTSPTPGHAMKVVDYQNAQGAIVGKAMTGLSEGKGLVLVLVNLH